MSIRVEPTSETWCFNLFEDDGIDSEYIGEVISGNWYPNDLNGEGFTPQRLRAVADAIDALEWAT